jgi:cell division protein FtsI/penicillin-binding protein 2
MSVWFVLPALVVAVADAGGVDAGDAGSADAGPHPHPAAADATATFSRPAGEGADSADGGEEEEVEAPSRLTSPPLARAKSIAADADLLALATKGDDGKLHAAFKGESKALTIDVKLQTQLESTLALYQTPWAAVVAIEPASGRVLAMAEHSEEDPQLRGLCTQALYPAASIFKIVTAAALLQKGVTPQTQACFHGGKRKLTPDLLEDGPRDSICYDMSTAMAKSANVVFAKLTSKNLSANELRTQAKAWGFNRPLDFPVPGDVSKASVPQDTFNLALTGAGFGDVYLSPLHGAELAAVVANGGAWRSPVLFEGETAAEARVVSGEVAAQLAAMMAGTVDSGTARRIFHERGNRLDDAVGKTGSLADKKPFRDYTWFVGYAPRENPKVAVGAVIVNDPYWRIRATWLGREAMRLYLEEQAAPKKPTAVAPAQKK